MTQDFVMGQLRMALMALVAFAGGKGWLTPTDSGLIVAFVTAIGPIFAPWIWSIVVNINTKRAPQQAVVIDPIMTTANASKMTATVQTTSGPITGKIVSVLLVAFALSFLVAGAPAFAQTKIKRPAVTGDPIADIKTDLTNAGLVPATGVTKNSDGTAVCNFNIFANLNPKNLQATIQACVSDANSTFEPDVAAALASAQAYGGSGDQTGIQCLQPALAIVQAGIVRPAVAAVAAQPATATSPAVPAVAAVAAYSPGLITIFQKFREFTLAGGPTACQNWVNGTIQGAVAPIAGVAGAAVGAAAIIP